MYRILWCVAAFAIAVSSTAESGSEKEADRKQAVANKENTDDLGKLYAEYHESFITKEAAEEMRLHLRNSKKTDNDEEDYDEMLQELLQKSKGKDHKKPIYEKKYFDYLPSEEAEKHKYPKDESTSVSLENSKSEEDSKSSEGRRINSRRFRRNVPNNMGREKRHFYQLASQQPYEAIFREPYHFYVPAENHFRTQYVAAPAFHSISYVWQPEFSPPSFRPHEGYQPAQAYIPANGVQQNRPYPPQNPPSTNNINYLPPSQPDRRYLPSAPGGTNIQSKFDGGSVPTDNRNFYFDQVVDPSRLKNYPARYPSRPDNFGSSNSINSIPSNQRTTPRPLSTSTFPPLIHNSDNNKEFDWDAYMPNNQQRPSRPNNQQGFDRNTERPVTTSTFPPLIHNSDGNTFDWDAWEESKAQGNNNNNLGNRRSFRSSGRF